MDRGAGDEHFGTFVRRCVRIGRQRADGGWFGVCGTSAASPVIASVFALAGNATSMDAGKKLWTLKARKWKGHLHAITSGSNGSCGGSYLCTAGTGQYKTYAGPTGWGTPNGFGAF